MIVLVMIYDRTRKCSPQINLVVRKRRDDSIEISPDLHIHIADLPIVRTADTPVLQDLLETLRRSQQIVDGGRHVSG